MSGFNSFRVSFQNGIMSNSLFYVYKSFFGTAVTPEEFLMSEAQMRWVGTSKHERAFPSRFADE